MHIESLYVQNFRCIETCEIKPSPGINCVIGDNGSGKTSLLETVYILSRGESFRQTSLAKAVGRYSKAFTLRTRLRHDDGRLHRIGAYSAAGKHQFKLNDQTHTRRYDLVDTLLLQYIDPNIHRLIEQGPKYRRHFLDWGVFHVERSFFPAWRRYKRALKQRNRALRTDQSGRQVATWDSELIQQGEIIDACRRRYINKIKQYLPINTKRLIGDDELHIVYRPGWRDTRGLGYALADSLAQDLRAGFTQSGPHRADIQISIASRQAKDWVSRGQQKLLTAGLLLAQAEILYAARGIKPVLLLDDMAAELGNAYRDALATEIKRINAQCFLTFLDSSSIPDGLGDTRLFHVEHGTLRTG